MQLVCSCIHGGYRSGSAKRSPLHNSEFFLHPVRVWPIGTKCTGWQTKQPILGQPHELFPSCSLLLVSYCIKHINFFLIWSSKIGNAVLCLVFIKTAFLTGGNLSHGNTNTMYPTTLGELGCAPSDIQCTFRKVFNLRFLVWGAVSLRALISRK